MANKRKYDKMLAEILIPNGFYRRGANFLRLHGDGVLQSIFFTYESPYRWFPEYGDANFLNIAVHSVYESKVFEETKDLRGPLRSLQGALTYCAWIPSYAGFEIGKTPRKNPECREGRTELQQLDLLNDQVLATLNQVDSQALLCDLLAWTDITEYGERHYVDTPNIAPLAHAHRYEEAIKFCDGIIENHMIGYEQKKAYLSPEQLRADRTASERILKPFREIKELMLQDDHDGIMRILEANRAENISAMLELFPKMKKELDVQTT